jgi:ubiquitin C-terminal hydrolase
MNLVSFDEKFLGGIFALHNNGNLCYMNSLIQALMSCPSFNHRILGQGSPLAKTYSALLRASRHKTRQLGTYSTANILRLLHQQRQSQGLQNNLWLGRQEDAHEGLVLLLDSLGGGLDSLFHVRHQSRIHCQSCGHNVDKYNPPEIMITLFDEISLADPQKYISRHRQPLPDYKCDRCGVRGATVQFLRLARLSEIIVVVFNKYDKKEIKQFPPTLQFRAKSGPLIYHVVAQVEHYGTMVGGHYNARCMRKIPANVRCSGPFGSIIFDDEVVKYSPAGFVPTNNTYLVFYHLFDPTLTKL